MHVFNAAGVPIAFVKIVTPAADWGRLETDHTMLTSLQSEPDLGFLTPRAISRGDYDGSCYSVQQPLPVGSESPRWGLKFRPSEILAKWTGSFDEVSTLRLSTYSWWDRYLSRLDENVVDFHQELVAKLNDSRAVRVGRVHGDFSASNVAFVKGTPWIFDWECAAIDAPFLTDDIGLFLSFRVGRVARNPQPHIDEFVRYFEKQLYLQRLDVMLAMAYRHACGFPDTPVYLSRWRKISKYV